MQSHVAEVFIVRFIAMLLLCGRCMAFQTGPLASTCERFHVSHGLGARNVNANVTILLRKMDGTEVSCIQTSENYRGAYSYALGWACVQPYLCKVCRGNGNFQLVKFIETALQH